MAALAPLPPEIAEHALALATPADVAAFAQTSRAARRIVYAPPDQFLWRLLFLRVPLPLFRFCHGACRPYAPHVGWQHRPVLLGSRYARC